MPYIAAITIIAVAALIAAVVAARGLRTAGPSSDAEGHGLSDGVAAAMEDVAGPMFGVNAHPTSPEALKRRIP